MKHLLLPLTFFITAGLQILGAAGEPVRLNYNENRFGFSPAVKAALERHIEKANYYNGHEITAMIKLCAEKEDVSPDHIWVAAGSGPVLELAAAAFVRPGANVVTAAPSYGQLATAFERRGGTVNYVRVDPATFGYDLPAMRRAIDGDTTVVYICNPNNPTGTLIDADELRAFIMSVPSDVLVFVDEAYLELSDADFATNTMAPLAASRPNVIVARTFSKAHGLAGIRAGYCIGQPDTLAALRRHDVGVGPGYLAAVAAQAALKDKAFLQENIDRYRAMRRYVSAGFDRMGIRYIPSHASFVLFHAGMPSAEFIRQMREKNIIVNRPYGLGPLEEEFSEWVRVSIGTQEDMDFFLSATAGILGKS